MCIQSIKVPIRKKSGNLLKVPRSMKRSTKRTNKTHRYTQEKLETVNLEFGRPYPDRLLQPSHGRTEVKTSSSGRGTQHFFQRVKNETERNIHTLRDSKENTNGKSTRIPKKRICRIRGRRRRILALQDNSITPTIKWKNRIFYETAK